ncbi:hypothetical protein SDC9_211815 [bioreactor metagenome]|uniref:Uncharacterized protein n=1 Tax=bioreactor metagenome TaxID=1076179 RepID=A0A645JWL4_9ZZZZ
MIRAPAHRLEGRAADGVLQLAHIARPAIGAQHRLGRRRQAQPAQPQARAVEFQKAPGQQQHVVATLAQRRNGDGVDRQPVV